MVGIVVQTELILAPETHVHTAKYVRLDPRNSFHQRAPGLPVEILRIVNNRYEEMRILYTCNHCSGVIVR